MFTVTYHVNLVNIKSVSLLLMCGTTWVNDPYDTLAGIEPNAKLGGEDMGI